MDMFEWAAWQPHHKAWLLSHPWWSPEWLKARLREGFDVHHLDGNHDNNDPANLVLIEHTDHLMLHGDGKTRHLGRIGRTGRRGKRKKREKPQRSGKRKEMALDQYEKMKRDLVASIKEKERSEHGNQVIP